MTTFITLVKLSGFMVCKAVNLLHTKDVNSNHSRIRTVNIVFSAFTLLTGMHISFSKHIAVAELLVACLPCSFVAPAAYSQVLQFAPSTP